MSTIKNRFTVKEYAEILKVSRQAISQRINSSAKNKLNAIKDENGQWIILDNPYEEIKSNNVILNEKYNDNSSHLQSEIINLTNEINFLKSNNADLKSFLDKSEQVLAKKENDKSEMDRALLVIQKQSNETFDRFTNNFSRMLDENQKLLGVGESKLADVTKSYRTGIMAISGIGLISVVGLIYFNIHNSNKLENQIRLEKEENDKKIVEIKDIFNITISTKDTLVKSLQQQNESMKRETDILIEEIKGLKTVKSDPQVVSELKSEKP